MAFSRTAPAPRPPANVLTARMVGIGMNFAAAPERDADLESTLAHAAQLGMDEGDLRVLSVLTTWLGVHRRPATAKAYTSSSCPARRRNRSGRSPAATTGSMTKFVLRQC